MQVRADLEKVSPRDPESSTVYPGIREGGLSDGTTVEAS
jgi:hypothetical protein